LVGTAGELFDVKFAARCGSTKRRSHKPARAPVGQVSEGVEEGRHPALGAALEVAVVVLVDEAGRRDAGAGRIPAKLLRLLTRQGPVQGLKLEVLIRAHGRVVGLVSAADIPDRRIGIQSPGCASIAHHPIHCRVNGASASEPSAKEPKTAMPMSDFFRAFPKLAESELRNFTIGPGTGSDLPAGRYGFIEAYCDEKGCDCRRVMIAVFSEEAQDFVAHINLGFDSEDEMAGPFLDPLDPQGPHAEELLAFFTDKINRDPAHVARLQRHYVQFKERIEGRRYAGRRFEEPGRVKRVAVAEPPMLPLAGGSDLSFAPAPTRRDAKIGRNDPCPCGSGKKYKRCCSGKPQVAPDSAATASEAGSQADVSQQPPAMPPDEAAQGRQAEKLVTAVVRWRQNPRHQERWGTDVQQSLEKNHALAFPLLRLLLMRYAPDGRRRSGTPQYDACRDLLEEAITQIRYSVERNRPVAVAMADQIQTEIAVQAFRPEVDVRVQQDLVMALHGAKLELHSDIREKAADVADYYARFSTGKGAPDLDGLLERLVRETKPRDVFDLLEPVLAEMDLMPVEAQTVLTEGMLISSQPVLNDLAVLMLLHPDPQVRTRLPDLYGKPGCIGKLSSLGLRRLIGLRNWLPAAERPGMDALIEAVRRAGIATAPLPRTEPVGVQASPFDGSGGQAAWVAVRDRRRYRIESVLVRQGDGVREAFRQRDLTKRELDGMGRRMSNASGTLRVDADYLHRMMRHFIAVGLDRGAPPPPQLLSTNEWAGRGYWTPDRISPADEIERLKATDPSAFTPERTRQVLANAANWPKALDFAAAWFEDDARIEALLREHIGAADRWLERLLQAEGVIMQGLLEQKRDIWTERLLWMSLWSAACPTRPPVPWQDFLAMAMVLQQGTALTEIPLMQAVAERSVQSAWQRSFRH